MTDSLPWRPEEEQAEALDREAMTESLRKVLVAKLTGINTAIYLGMEPEEVEDLVDDLWDGLRALVRSGDEDENGRRVYEDIVMGLALESLTHRLNRAMKMMIEGIERKVVDVDSFNEV